jgi:uncharacterized protein
MQRLRPVNDEDIESLLKLNNAEVPAVNFLEDAVLRALCQWSDWTYVAEGNAGIEGLLLALGPGHPYDSENYRFFAERHEDFHYVDRIVIGKGARRRGIGRRLYDALVAATSSPLLCCEVNLRPANPVSLAFHVNLGFREVGRQTTSGGSKLVALLERPLAHR